MNKLYSIDWMKIAKGAVIAGGGAALTYLSQYASGADFGAATPIVVAGLSVLVNVFRKWASNGNEQNTDS